MKGFHYGLAGFFLGIALSDAVFLLTTGPIGKVSWGTVFLGVFIAAACVAFARVKL